MLQYRDTVRGQVSQRFLYPQPELGRVELAVVVEIRHLYFDDVVQILTLRVLPQHLPHGPSRTISVTRMNEIHPPLNGSRQSPLARF